MTKEQTKEVKEEKKETAIVPQRGEKLVDVIGTRVKQLQSAGNIDLPTDYSWGNSLKSAFLALSAQVNKDKRLVLEACTPASITNALLDMVIQGLNFGKKQCYFIPYNDTLTMQRSYFGDMALAKRINKNIGDIIAAVVYEGDEFKFSYRRGKKIIESHVSTLESQASGKIKAAYCEVLSHDGEVICTGIMTMPEIIQSWKQNKFLRFDEKGNVATDTVHSKFPADMAMKTVIRKTLKPIINSSDDEYLSRSIRQTDDVAAEAVAMDEIDANANKGDIIDIQGEEIVEQPVAEQKEAKQDDEEPF